MNDRHLLPLLLVLAGCHRDAPAGELAPAATSSSASAPSAASALSLHLAQRCGECHGDIHEEWKGSGHAKARGPAYAAMRGNDASCDRCHAPLASVAVTNPLLPKEGVTCEVCHAIASARADKNGAAFEMKLAENVKYGPLCDAKNHYFHKMGCSPLHDTSAFCAGCHLLYAKPAGSAPLPVFTEYEEWEASPQGQSGIPCQSCHMPSRKAEVAVGAAKRSVSFHGSVAAGDLRRGAFKLKVSASKKNGRVHVDVTVTNVGAAHAVPTGAPERRLVLSVSAGGVVSEKVYGRVLVDAAGNEVPFTKAARVREDTRLRAGETRTESFDLDVPSKGVLEAKLSMHDVAPAIAAQLGVVGGGTSIVAATIDLAKGLPKTVEVAP